MEHEEWRTTSSRVSSSDPAPVASISDNAEYGEQRAERVLFSMRRWQSVGQFWLPEPTSFPGEQSGNDGSSLPF